MKDWQLEAMMGAEESRKWSGLNNPEEEALMTASSELRDAILDLNSAIGSLNDAAEELIGTTAQDRVISFVDELETIRNFLEGLYTQFRTGKMD